MNFDYRMKLQTISLGDLNIKMNCIADVDEATNTMFDELERRGEKDMIETMCPFFGVFWASANALITKMQKIGAKEFRGKNFLELGCGLAAPSLLAAKMGAKVTASDFHPDVDEFLKYNLRENEISNLRFHLMDWKKPDLTEKYDWIVASDVLYETYHPQVLAKVLTDLIADNGKIIVTDPGRAYVQNFFTEMQKIGFQSKMDIMRVDDDGQDRDIFVLEFES